MEVIAVKPYHLCEVGAEILHLHTVGSISGRFALTLVTQRTAPPPGDSFSAMEVCNLSNHTAMYASILGNKVLSTRTFYPEVHAV